LRQVGGGCHSQGGVLPPQVGGEDLYMDTIRPPLSHPPPYPTPRILLTPKALPYTHVCTLHPL
jgi:hypothetical protein